MAAIHLNNRAILLIDFSLNDNFYATHLGESNSLCRLCYRMGAPCVLTCFSCYGCVLLVTTFSQMVHGANLSVSSTATLLCAVISVYNFFAKSIYILYCIPCFL